MKEFSKAQWVMRWMGASVDAGTRLQRALYATAYVLFFAAGVIGFIASLVRFGKMPSQAVLYSREADALRSQGKLEQLLKQYQLAARLSPDANVLGRLADVQMELGLKDESAETLKELVRLSPRNPDLRATWAAALYESGQFQEAEKEFASAIYLGPTSLQPRLQYARMLESLGRMDDAGILLRDAVRHNPESAEAQDALGSNLADRGLNKEAEVALREAVRLDPESAPAWNNLGTILIAQNRLAEATQCFAAAVRLDPESFDYRWNLAHALKDSGDGVGALREFRALEQRPSDPESAGAVQSAIKGIQAPTSGGEHGSN